MTLGIATPQGLALLAQATSGPGGIGSILFLVLPFFVIWYFLMIMPQQRRQKKVAAMLANLKNGDKVITNGGIYGTIVGIEGDTVQLRIAEQVKIKIACHAIGGLQADPKES
ncbi:MAG: preprotein translocase subunit YajC [Candidatus Acidiferrales bacterium]